MRVLQKLGLSPLYVVDFRVLSRTVVIRFVDTQRITRCRLCDHKLFAEDFVSFRREAGRKRGARAVSGGYMVPSSEGGEYFVEMTDDAPVCPCCDYQEQVQAWGRGVCLHGYAALIASGFETLAEYQQANRKEVAA